jgi:MFS family permease
VAHTGSQVEATPRISFVQAFSSLQYRDYRLLWFSTLFSSAGNWIQQVTLGWLLYDISGSAFLVGTLHGARALPFLLAGPIAGVLTDRMDRRRLLIVTQLCLALLALGFALLVILDMLQVWHFFVFTVLTGFCWAVNHPVRQALVANTVPRQSLMNAVALITVAFNINRIAGPTAGGLLIAFFGPGNNFVIQAVCFATVALVVLPMRVRQGEQAAAHGISTLASLREGVNYVVKEETTLALILLTMVPSIFLMPVITGLMPVFAKDVLGAGPDGLGLLLSGLGVGALIGPLVLAMVGDVPRKGLFILGAGLLSSLGVIAFSRTTAMATALPILAAVGATQMLYYTVVNTVLQTVTPDAFRGRVMSLYMMDHGLVPLGSLLAGTLAQLHGSPLAMLTGGAISTSLVLLSIVRFRTIRSMA